MVKIVRNETGCERRNETSGERYNVENETTMLPRLMVIKKTNSSIEMNR